MSTEKEMAKLADKAKKKGKQPYVGKEKRKTSAKLPVPPPKQGRTILVGEGERVQLDPLTPEQKAVIDAKVAKMTAANDPTAKSDLLRKQQKEAKRESDKTKRVAKKQKAEAAAAGKTTSMPLTGKAALRAIADKAVREHPVTKVPATASGKPQKRVSAKGATQTPAEGKKNGKASPDAKTQPERREIVKKMLAKDRAPRKLKSAPSGKITVLAKENPKRDKAAKRFALYKNGMATADYIDAAVAKGASESLARADLRWDVSHGFISVK